MFQHLKPMVAIDTIEVRADAHAADEFVGAHAIVVDHFEDEIRIFDQLDGHVELQTFIVLRIQRVRQHRCFLLANLLSVDQ